MKSRLAKIVVVLGVVLLLAAFFMFDLGQYFTLQNLKAQQHALQTFYHQHQALTIGGYFLIYVAVTALSLPGAVVMTLAGGMIFGFWTGTLIVSFASSIGALLAFLVSRFVLRESIQSKFRDKLEAINEGIRKEGAFYLFTLRLVPIFPFFIINLVMGLTSMRWTTYYLVSQIGMLPGTFVYINAGTQLGQLTSLKGILSPGLLLSFALLGLFPLIANKIVGFIKARRVYAKYKRPRRFDYNLVVIGAGSAGLVSAYIAAAVKAKVALIEKHKMGGDCLYTGCVPSKALIRSAKMLSYVNRAEEFGFDDGSLKYDFGKIMERVQAVIAKVEPHDSVERYSSLGVECIRGDAYIKTPWEIEVGERTLSTRNIVIATGAFPFVPPIEGIDRVPYLTSDNLWELRELPRQLVVLGGGPIGCEMTQAFARLGATVTQVEMGSRIMPREDETISDMLQSRFADEGIRVLTGHRAIRVDTNADAQTLICEHDGKEVHIPFDRILVAVGRVANTSGFGLEELGVRLTPQRTVDTNPMLQTNYPNIYCAGDVAGPYQFTHTASHQAWYASVNALFGGLKRFKVDYRVIPWATYTDPEVARVGLNELEAREQGIDYQLAEYGMGELDRAIADSEDYGVVRVLTPPKGDKILGVTIVGAHASDIIAEFILAMKYGLGLNKILGTIHIYPTLAEANKAAAGEWKKNNVPHRLLAWVQCYQRWMRKA